MERHFRLTRSQGSNYYVLKDSRLKEVSLCTNTSSRFHVAVKELIIPTLKISSDGGMEQETS